MAQAVMLILALLLPLVLLAPYLFRRQVRRRRTVTEELSPVSRQHIDLFQGGQLSEAALESAKRHLRTLLERGEVEAIEASLRPGTHYVVLVRALAELGTDDAGKILERQLGRQLTEDQIEQSWYWIDLANGLRSLNRSQSLPHLLRCAEKATEVPLGHFFAAETVCFLGFSGYVHQPTTPLGRSALRLLIRALEGLRMGVQAQMVAESRLGELIEGLWDSKPEPVDPLVVRVFHEVRRYLRRAHLVDLNLGGESVEQEAFQWQLSRLSALEPSLCEYIDDAPAELLAELPTADAETQRDILQALIDLRADTKAQLLPLLTRPSFAHPDLAVQLLRWSSDPGVAPMLRGWALHFVPMLRRTQRRPSPQPPLRPSIPPTLPYRAILQALRGHPSSHTENFLLLAAHDWDPMFRSAAMSSLGWWEPLRRSEVLVTLEGGRRDPNPEVRQAARAALSRLGERQALQSYRQFLTDEDSHRVHQTIQVIANEVLTLLWPDLDLLADSDDPDVAHHAREAIAHLAEDMESRRR